MDDPRPPAPPAGSPPPAAPPAAPTSEDAEHLQLLSIFHYVVAAFAALFALLPSFHLVMGLWLAAGGPGGELSGSEEHAFIMLMGGFMSAFAGTLIVCGLAFAGCLVAAGRFLATRTHYTFCLVMAGISCAFIPFGTVLGVFTIVVLMRPSVKAAFGRVPAT